MAIGVAAGFLLAMSEMAWRDWVAIAVVVAIWGLGFADDLWKLRPSIRLAAQILGGAVLWSAGWQVHWFGTPALNLAFTCVIFAFFVNAINMLDGADGLAAGVAAVGAIGLVILLRDSTSGFILALCLVAVCSAMLLYNFPPASIFMGDSGSMLIGALIGLLVLQKSSVGTGIYRTLPAVIFFLVPAGDSGLAIFRRLRSRHSPFQGDRRHYYDLLLQRGWSGAAILGFSYGATALLVCAGLLCEKDGAIGFPLAGALAIALLAFAWVIGSFTPEQSTPEPEGTHLLPKIQT